VLPPTVRVNVKEPAAVFLQPVNASTSFGPNVIAYASTVRTVTMSGPAAFSVTGVET
jgi:hypothetical protein